MLPGRGHAALPLAFIAINGSLKKQLFFHPRTDGGISILKKNRARRGFFLKKATASRHDRQARTENGDRLEETPVRFRRPLLRRLRLSRRRFARRPSHALPHAGQLFLRPLVAALASLVDAFPNLRPVAARLGAASRHPQADQDIRGVHGGDGRVVQHRLQHLTGVGQIRHRRIGPRRHRDDFVRADSAPVIG